MSKNVTIICGDEQWFRSQFPELEDFRFRMVSSAQEVAQDSECVLISQEFAGDRLLEMLRTMKQLLIPAGVVTFQSDRDNQDYLMDCGAEDVLILPMAGRLLQKRLHALAGSSVLPHTSVDFAAFDKIREANQGNGSFVVQENDFANIYRFVVRLLDRLDQKAQLIIFNFDSDLGPFIEIGNVYNFIKIVQAVLRRGDICSICGQQVFVILLGADAESGQKVVKRMIDTFDAHYNDDTCEITYEMREIRSDSQ